MGAGGFQAVSEAAQLMSPFRGTWLVVGGWAVDLFIGQPTREHDDVDIGLARHDQVAARRWASRAARSRDAVGRG